uniref:hypothetical protein n=1 Tax=Pseudoerythrocladia kornmannii TaxID=753682 RepID=UPI001FCE100C|nr:hypothetical protein MW575_pgp031 [Pseudoerythrocladia kornmannii]UNJ16829.1 hypothetical protein [Pseudoerythrocladia kornmannii]
MLFILYHWCFLINQKTYYSFSENTVWKTKINNYQYNNSIINLDKKNNIEKKIHIQGITDTSFKTQIRNIFNLDDLEKISGAIKKSDMGALLKRMKLSGYFTKIQIKSEIVNKIQNIDLDCTVMPILTNINFKNNKNLIIPEILLHKTFKDQLGKPKNFQHLHKGIKTIYQWYYTQGYHWVQINIVEESKQNNAVEIEISEGFIDSIQFKFSDKSYNVYNQDQTKSIQLIRNFLNIREHVVLNYQEIESQINELKEKKIFNSCDYTVLYSKKHAKQLDLIISVYDLPDKTAFLLGKNTSFATGIIESIESQALNSINTLFWKSFDTNRINNINLEAETIYRNTQSNLIYNSQLLVNRILTQPNFYSLKDLYEWYAKPLNFIVENSLIIRYNIHNLGKTKEYSCLRFNLPNIHKNFTLIYCKPWISLSKQQTILMQYKFIKQSFYAKNKQIKNILNSMLHSNFVFSNLLFDISKIKSKVRIKLNRNIVLKIMMESQANTYSKNSLKAHPEILFNQSSKSLNTKNNNLNTIFQSIPHRNQKTLSTLISIGTKLKYNTEESNDINWLKQGTHLTVLSKYFIPLKYIKNTIQNYHYKFANRTIIKSTLFKIFNFNEKKGWFSRQCLLLDLEIGHLSGSSSFFPYLEQFELRSPEAIRGYPNNILDLPKSFYKNSIEYHLASPNNHSLFVFIDYIKKNDRKLFPLTEDILKLLMNQCHNNHSTNKMTIGLGYQLRTPIKKLPPIRLEYSINIMKERYIHLRVTQVLSSIAIQQFH